MESAISLAPNLQQFVRDAAVASDLGDYAEQLVGLARPSLVLATSRAKASTIAVGTTKFGGSPDLPDSIEWPTWNRQLLDFYAQINLADVAEFQLGLPSEGLLSFFFAEDFDATRPQCSGAGVVHFFRGDNLHRRKHPPRAPDRFRNCTVKSIPYPSLPQAYSDEVAKVWGLDFLTDDENHANYAECISSIDAVSWGSTNSLRATATTIINCWAIHTRFNSRPLRCAWNGHGLRHHLRC